jgi:roadblock/LC7 domain-containing protein
VVGLEWSVVVDGNCGVVVRNRDADYEATFKALQPA